MNEKESMIKNQIINRGITNKKVLKALLSVNRDLFVIEKFKYEAYADTPLPIGYNQTISQPYIVALMTELLNPQSTDQVLEIGTGSGYQTAILAELVKRVYTIEIIGELSEKAAETLNYLNYKNIILKQGNGYEGWEKYSPFDKIIVTAAPEMLPQKLFAQLKEGGLMVIPVGKNFQELLLISKKSGKMIRKKIIDVRFVPMVHQ